MSALQNNQFLLASGSPTDPTFPVQRSVRLRSSASAYFNRTPASAGNRQIFTYSIWLKRGALGSRMTLLDGFSAAAGHVLELQADNALEFYAWGTGPVAMDVKTTPVFRDASAWYHIVLSVDTTQVTPANRVIIYINGIAVPAYSITTYPAQNSSLYINNNIVHNIGRRGDAQFYLDGYLTEVNFIDGQALTPSSFGGYNSGTGVWEPRKYAGTYNTNGFYLNFQDNSGATATTIGKDSSGNGNNWTPNNISVTAGVTYDSMLDVPTNTSPTNANFATWNPLNAVVSTLTQGNLLSTASGSTTNVVSTFPTATTGKWYAEIGIFVSPNINWPMNMGASDGIGGNTYCRLYTDWSARAIFKSINGTTSSVSFSGSLPANGDILKIAYDADAGKLWIGLNSGWYGTSGSITGDPATGTDATISGIAGKEIYPNHSNAGGPAQNAYLNCGQRPFTYTPPSGFKSLNTYNLPDPTIASGDDFHKVYTYTGNGGGLQVGEIQKPASLFNLDRSLRFRSANSAYLTRTPASNGNQKTWTWSCWVKSARNGGNQLLLNTAISGSSFGLMSLSASTWRNANDTIHFESYVSNVAQFAFETTQVFRDPSAWYHIVINVDTTQATASNRVKIYVNGIQVTAFSTATYPSLNLDVPYFNSTTAQQIGTISTGGGGYLDGYLADVYFIDGQALTPTDFGAYDGNYYWTPKAYTGTYGTNGFHLEFEDFSAATAAAIGKDTSGQGNNWTPNGINVTTPANTNASWDSMTDVPTLTSTDVANFCVIDRLRSNTGITISDANLKAAITSSSQENLLCTLGVSSGKWYWEVTSTFSGADLVIGVVDGSVGTTRPTVTGTAYQYDIAAALKWNGGSGTSYGAVFASGDTLGIALDLDVGSITFYRNGVSQGVAFTGIPNKTWYPSQWKDGASASYTSNYNFGQRPFRYTPPTGFKSLNSFNVAEVTDDLESPDFVWIKSRSAATGHALFNSVTGVGKYLSSNATTAETPDVNSLIQFNKNGFLLGNAAIVNTSAATYVASAWKGGSTTVTNTSGSISSQVRANQKAGFSIVTYTGTGANATVGHGLGIAPRMIIVKSRSITSQWAVYHQSLGNTNTIYLNLTNAVASQPTFWNSTTPTSSTFSLGTDATVNGSTSTYVAYCFSEIAGFSKFGSYTGNGSADGPFVYLGFKPRWVLIKCTNDTAAPTYASWIMYDSLRNSYNVTNNTLLANFSTVENIRGVGTGAMGSVADIDLLSNGIKIRGSAGVETNVSGENYIYMAFAENPFKYSLAR